MEMMKTPEVGLLQERIGQDCRPVSLKGNLKVIVEAIDLDLKPPTSNPHDDTPLGSRWGGDEVFQDPASVKVDHGMWDLEAFVGLASRLPKRHANAKEMPSLVACLLVEPWEIGGEKPVKCPVPASTSRSPASHQVEGEELAGGHDEQERTKGCPMARASLSPSAQFLCQRTEMCLSIFSEHLSDDLPRRVNSTGR
jgi:hypothetical protein